MGGLFSTKKYRSSAGKQTANRMEDSTDILQKGLDVLTKAVEEDKNHNYEEALRFYVQGVMYLLHVGKYYTETESIKNCIKVKCAQYIARIKKIKAYRNKIHGVGLIDNLDILSDSNVLNMVTEIMCMCEDFTEQPEKEKQLISVE
ncbi:hypothetical protein PYW08_015839 [Mythimna loreyi]|uniref:Uncharacterized protein n=1 Tax=Mythimna loreyi TaxID=667449 RepID=A0ACC2QSE0_9NEOP|nr:hypothetical protein PYW08_015839 [Mythimna loreyi]